MSSAPTEDVCVPWFPINVYLHVYYHPSMFVGLVAKHPAYRDSLDEKNVIMNTNGAYQVLLWIMDHYRLIYLLALFLNS